MSVDTHSEGIEGTRYLKFTCYFSNREKKIMREIFGEEYPNVDLTDRDVMRILGRVRQSSRMKLNTSHIVPHIKRHYYLLTDSEVADILDPALTPQEQTLRLIDYLVFKGTYGLGCLYFSLVETSEEMYGLPTHFQLACELKKAIIEGSCIHNYSLTAEAVSDGQETKEAVDYFISQLGGVVISASEGYSLAQSLGIQLQGALTDLKEVCSVWRRKRSALCIVEDLVEALVLTRNLGRHTARLCSPELQHSVILKSFFNGLGVRWLNIAYYLGYTEAEVATIVEGDVEEESCERQVTLFLEVWQMPDCGPRTVTILQKLKIASRVPDSGRPSSARKQVMVAKPTVNLDACERVQFSQSLRPSSTSYPSSYSSTSSLPSDTTYNGSSYPTQRTLLVYQPGGDYGDDTPGRMLLIQASYYPTGTDNYDTPGRFDNTGPQIEELPSGTVSNTAEYRQEQLKTLLARASEAKSKSPPPTSESGTTSVSSQQPSKQPIKSNAMPDSVPPSSSLQVPNGPHSVAQPEATSSRPSDETSMSSVSFLSPAVPAENLPSEKPPVLTGISATDLSRQPETLSSPKLEAQPLSQLQSTAGEHPLASLDEQIVSGPSSTAASSTPAASLTAGETQPSSVRTESSISALADGASSGHVLLSEPVAETSSDDHPLLVTPKTVTVVHGFHGEPQPAGAAGVSLESMRSRGLEILHDFSQYLIAAALRRNKTEDIISAAEKRGHTELVNFFYQYFFDRVFHGRGGELVGAFLKGFPSPMMFLLMEKLATRDDFESVLEDYGMKDFGDQLAMAFHQVSENTETLPWSGSELLDGMFSQGSVFATVSSSTLDGSVTTGTHHIPPDLLHQLLSRSHLTLRQPEGLSSLPVISSTPAGPSRPLSMSRPEESKPTITEISSQPSDVPSDPIDVSSHARLPTPSSEHSSFTNDLNNLDLMDEGGPAAEATNVFFEDQALHVNAWDAEGVQVTEVVVTDAEEEGATGQPTPSSTTTRATTPTTATTATTNDTGTTPTATTLSPHLMPLAAPVLGVPQLPASLLMPGVATARSTMTSLRSETSDGHLRRENAYNSRLLSMASSATDTPTSFTDTTSDPVSSSTDMVTTTAHSATDAPTTPTASSVVVVASTTPVSSTAELSAVVTGAMETEAHVQAVVASDLTHDTTTATSEEVSTLTSPEPLSPTLTVGAMRVATDGADLTVTAMPRTVAEPTPTFDDPLSSAAATTSLSPVPCMADVTRTLELVPASSSPASVTLTAPTSSVDAMVVSTAVMTSSITTTHTTTMVSSVAIATTDSASVSVSSEPVEVPSCSSPLFTVAESVDERTDSMQASDMVANASVDRSDSEGSDSEPGFSVEPLSSLPVTSTPSSTSSLRQKPALSTSSKSGTVAMETGNKTLPTGPADNSPSSSDQKSTQLSTKRKSEKVAKTPTLGARKSVPVVVKTDKLSTAKRSKGPVHSETSLPKTGSVRVPIPGKKPVKDAVCKSHTPARTSGSATQRTRLALVEHTKKEDSTKLERTASKSGHSQPRSSARVPSLGSLSSSSEEFVSGKRDAGESLKSLVRDRASIGKTKAGISSGSRTVKHRNGSQGSVTSLRLSKNASGSKVNSSPSAKSGAVARVSKPIQHMEGAKLNSKGMKGSTSTESLPKMDGGMLASPVAQVASSHNSTTSSPHSERRYSHLPISDSSSESDSEIGVLNQISSKQSLSVSSLQSLTQEAVDNPVTDTMPEDPAPEPEPLVTTSQAESKAMEDSSNPCPQSQQLPKSPPPDQLRSEPCPQSQQLPKSPPPDQLRSEPCPQSQQLPKSPPPDQLRSEPCPQSQQLPNSPPPDQLRSEPFEQQHSEILSGPIQNSSVIFKTLASRLHNWKMLGRYLLLEDEELARISKEYTFTAEQAYQMLMTWMSKNPSTATYTMLIESLQNSLREDLAMEVLQAAKLSQKGLVVQVFENSGTVAFNADLSRLWQTMQPFVDQWTKDGYSQVEVNLRFKK